MANNKITLTDTKRKVLVQALEAVGWAAMPVDHPDRKAAEALLKELKPERMNRVTKERDGVTVNTDQRLYVIPCEDGYSCLGFDVAHRWASDVLNWLQCEMAPIPIKLELSRDNVGTLKGYNEYKAIIDTAGSYAVRANKRCESQLTPQLIGLEKKTVEVVDQDGQTRRFLVGKSMGWLPIHLEVGIGDIGGPAAYGPYKSVRVLEGK